MLKLLLLFLLLFAFEGYSQTLIMNEVSQGEMGNMEYVEFVVIDTTVSYDCTSGVPPSIDIRGWIFDDNNGYHGPNGIATGAIRFSFDPMWSNIPLGTIILIYNDADPNPEVPAIDVSMADGNCQIVAPISDINLFESNATTPGAVACSYPAAGWIPGGNWSNTVLRNGGDCARIVDLGGCEVFSVCWGDVSLNTLIYFAGSATNTVYYFNDMDPNNQINWSSGCADLPNCGTQDQTPGAPNNAANAAFIGSYNNGCTPIPPMVASAVIDNDELCSCDGEATASAVGSIPGYSFEWYDNAFVPIGQSTPTATALCPGTYNVIITSAIDCSDTATITIAPGIPFSVTAINSGVSCSGDTVVLNETGGDAVGWVWSSNGSASIVNSTDQSPIVIGAVDGEIFTVVATNVQACLDSSQTTLTINAPITFTDVNIACANYTWIDGVTYTSTTNTPTYTYVGGAANGCDSIVTLDLTINAPATATDVQLACVDYTWIDGVTYTSTTNTPTYTYAGGAANGCDSTVTLDLTINAPTTSTDVNIACANYTWIDGVTYTATTNTPTYTYVGGAANGCDSTVTLDLTINAPATATDVHIACANYTWIDGVTYTSTTNTPTYTYAGGAANGCDSTVTLDLTINAPATATDVQLACVNYTWIDGVTYTSTTNTPTYTYAGGAANGCDSTVTLDLTIGTFVTTTDVQLACVNYTWIDGVTYTVTTNTPTYTYVGGTANGCDSTVTLDLTINDCELIVPSAFTPDNDQYNDDWEILGLDEVHPSNKVFIYNRWGNLLFESPQGAYNSNRWDGTYKGNKLPVGSYYYIIEFNDNLTTALTGTVSIILN